MKKLLMLIFIGIAIFIGGQWIGLEIQNQRRQSGDASVPLAEPVQDKLTVQ